MLDNLTKTDITSCNDDQGMIFDMNLKRLIPVSTLWDNHREKIDHVVTKGANRLSDLDIMSSTLKEARTIVSVRESDTILKINREAEMLIHIIKMRQKELVDKVQGVSLKQINEITKLSQKADEMKASIRSSLALIDDRKCPISPTLSIEGQIHGIQPQGVSYHLRLAELYTLEESLKVPVFFDAPAQVLFEICSRALPIDECLSLATVTLPTPVPSSLAVCIPANVDVCCNLPTALNPVSQRTSREIRESKWPLSPSSCSSSFKNDIYINANCNANFANDVHPDKGPFGVFPGIIHFLSTSGQTKQFRNAHVEGLVTITANMLCGNIPHLVRDCMSGKEISHKSCRTTSEIDGRIIIDFGPTRKVSVQAYSLQHGHQERHAALMSWIIIASNDRESWVVLDKRRSDESLSSGGPFNTKVFFVSGSGDNIPSFLPESAIPSNGLFRYVALQIDGPNAEEAYHIEVSHIELYGKVRAV